MAKSSDVKAGKASVAIGADDSGFGQVVDRAERRLKLFAANAIAFGAKVSGFGVSIGAGLLTAGTQFGSIGSKIEAVNKQMVGLKAGSPELMKLQEEAARLNKILGGESLESAKKLNEGFRDLKDGVSGVVVKLGGTMAPAITSLLDYLKKGVDSVGKFIERNRALAPQIATVAAACVVAGGAIAALGLGFYVAGPVIRLAMLGASIATLAFSASMVLLNTTVAVASATLRVLTGAVTLGVAAIRALHLGTVLYNVTAAACSLVARALGVTFGVLFTITKAVTIATLAAAAAWATAKIGMIGLSAAIKTAYGLYRMLTIAQIGVAVSSAIVSVGLAGIGIGIAAGIVAFFAYTDAGRQAGASIANVFVRMKDAVLSAFGSVNMEGARMPSMFSGYFNDVASMASSAWSGIVSTAKSVFASASELFMDLLGTAKQTFAGVSDAIAAGNIQLAMDTLWAGLKVAWTQGTDAFKSAWGTSLIYIEGALDICVTNLKMIWDVGIAYMAGAFDKFTLGVRNQMQDVSNSWAEWIANTGIFGEVDAESIQEENKAQTDKLNSGAKEREDARNKQIANAGNDEGSKKRAKEREDRLKQVGGPSAELESLRAELLKLQGQAALEALDVRNKAKEAGKPGAEQGKAVASTMNTAAAQARNSSGAASTIAKAANGGLNNIPQQQLAEAKKMQAELKLIAKAQQEANKKPPVLVKEFS